MKKALLIYFFLLFSCFSRAQVNDRHLVLAEEFLLLLQQGKYNSALVYFDEMVRGQVSAEKLREIWTTINIQAGSFREHFDTRTETVPGYDIVYLACHFENTDLDIKLVFDKDMKIAGFFFTPSGSKEEYHIPSYDEPANYIVEDVEIITGDYQLPGEIIIPAGLAEYPLVILVHGSGPNDRDETIGPNKPFKDLASGLARYGIGTLRYDKRTKVYGTQIDPLHLTVYEETVEDAETAISMARNRDHISGVFLLGHSLGAFVAPRIASGEKPPDAIIMMAGNARPLEDLVMDQFTYLLSVDGLTSSEKETLENLGEKVDRVKHEDISENTPRENLPLGLPPVYWNDLRKYDPVETARKLDLPVLILQGERDYQVTMQDFALWKETLEGKDNVTMISYPELNHLFIEGQGRSLPSEYEKAGNIPEYVIRDISDWIFSVVNNY